jgi:hypothetical protein
MTEADPKTDLHRYLRGAREALLWKLDGLSEYDIRRPLTLTGTSLHTPLPIEADSPGHQSDQNALNALKCLFAACSALCL